MLNIINMFFDIRINYSFRKKEKKIQKKIFFVIIRKLHRRFKNVIVTSKVKRRRQQRSIERKGILKQSESEDAPNIQEATASNSIQVCAVILQDQVTIFIINFTNLI